VITSGVLVRGTASNREKRGTNNILKKTSQERSQKGSIENVIGTGRVLVRNMISGKKAVLLRKGL